MLNSLGGQHPIFTRRFTLNTLNSSVNSSNSLPVITTFVNSDMQIKVRSVLINNEPYFVGKDVAIALGYSKPQNAIAEHVDEDDALKQGITDSLGRIQDTIIINESGVYSLVFGSKLPKAKEFKRWVTSEVLPSIRKNGSYSVPKTYAEALQLAANQAKQIEEMQPKAEVYNRICNSESLKPVDQVASNLGYGKNNFFALMRGMGIFYYSSKDADGKKVNLPKQEYKDRGYFVTKEEPYNKGDKDCLYTKIYVTGKGELWLSKKLTEETAESFIDKGEKEYQKIMDETADAYIGKGEAESLRMMGCSTSDIIIRAMKNCPPSDNTILDKCKKVYTIFDVAKLCKESAETVINYCKLRSWMEDDGSSSVYGRDIVHTMTNGGYITEKGKDEIVKTYQAIRENEKKLRKTSLGKAE